MISLDSLWYGKHPVQWILRPFSWVFQIITRIRRWYLEQFCQKEFQIPIIVVGNLTVGGVGKTPLVIALAKTFQERGFKVGIVSRGYQAKLKQFPHEVTSNDSAMQVGDEPLLITLKTQCPVVIDPDRVKAVQYLLKTHQPQIILSDDGLQHYRMGRAIEILVIDGRRGLGNGLCLPAGPLRESKKRLKQVDLLICTEGNWDNAFSMQLIPSQPIHLATGQSCSIDLFQNPVAAVAGIGNPKRFYATLDQLKIPYKPYTFPDHFQFTTNDLNYPENQILMTEKDAVKCKAFPLDTLYYLPVEARLSDAFWTALWSLEQLKGYS